MKRLRVCLYSHDAMGLGHMRRNLLLAEAFTAGPIHADVLLISGASEIQGFSLPVGAGILTLPAMRKDPHGRYVSRSLRFPVEEVSALRADLILTALKRYSPDVLLVDKHPRGLLHELDPSLRYLLARGQTRMILGFRDILDTPSAVRREWLRAENEAVVRDFYDSVWIYGDPVLFDARREYNFSPSLRDRIRFTGYLDPTQRSEAQSGSASDKLPPRFSLCLLGGGQDGLGLAKAFADAVGAEKRPSVLLTGPFMSGRDRQYLRERAAANRNFHVLDFTPEPRSLLRRAQRVVTMGGYNTVLEVLTQEKPLLIVPRVHPRREQSIRASRLEQLGLAEVLHPDQVSGDSLRSWLEAIPIRPVVPVREVLDLGGLERVGGFLLESMIESGRLAEHS
jgi:predicted glycosyltransferase